jgi:cobalt-zinc-cadmium efflux system protein
MHNHNHDHSSTASTRALWWALIINAAFLLVEFIGGLLTNSLALLADAGHMLTDVAALTMALIAGKIASRNANQTQTYGFGRVKVIVALLNGLSLWLIVGVIVWEAVHRFLDVPEVKSLEMLIIATAGLAANAISAWILMSHQKTDINVRGAFLHLVADSLGSVGAILAGVAMLWKGWFIVDPLASILISVIILWSSFGIVKNTMRILMESTPSEIDLESLKEFLETFKGVDHCHDLHVWLIDTEEPILTAHLVVTGESEREDLLNEVTRAIHDRYGINHATIQLEFQAEHPDLGCG